MIINYSIGVRLSWEIAGHEAAIKKSPFIEVDHIMLGILSLDKILPPFKVRLGADMEQLNYEKKKLRELLDAFGLDINALRIKLRRFVRDGKGVFSRDIFHRSEDCKKMFSEAECLANHFLTVNHLFITILRREKSSIRVLLTNEGVDTEKFKTEIMSSFCRNN
ncbi:MAG: Clp protease N-terminal domain-containing protein [Prolixibacteraceae bacterium]